MSNSTTTPLTPGERWEQLSSEDKALVMRVETEVLDFFDQQQARPAPAAGLLRWWWASVPALLAAAAVFFVWNRDFAPPPLQLQGGVVLQSKEARASERRLTLANAGMVRDPQGWSLRAHASTPLVIRRSGKARADVSLHKGAVSFQVRPGSMKRFVVHCHRRWKVVVKGTKFLVWQNPRGLRVEVFRGHVLLTHRGRERLHLYKGQGAYLPAQSKAELQTYPLPAQRAEQWLARVEQLALKQPSVLAAYVRDLLQDGLLSPTQQLQVLETAAHGLQGAKRWAEAHRLWSKLWKRSQGSLSRQTALFHAAESCRLGRLSSATCVGLYRRLLREFPKALPSLRESAFGRLLGLERGDRRALARQYLQEFPRGRHGKRARSLLSPSPAPRKRTR